MRKLRSRKEIPAILGHTGSKSPCQDSHPSLSDSPPSALSTSCPLWLKNATFTGALRLRAPKWLTCGSQAGTATTHVLALLRGPEAGTRGKAEGQPPLVSARRWFVAISAAYREGGQPLLGLADEVLRCRSLPLGTGMGRPLPSCVALGVG